MQHDVFAFKTAHGKAHKIVDCDDLACVSVAPRAVWTLSCDGEIRVRTGMGPSYLQGTEWACLDLAQLGELVQIMIKKIINRILCLTSVRVKIMFSTR